MPIRLVDDVFRVVLVYDDDNDGHMFFELLTFTFQRLMREDLADGANFATILQYYIGCIRTIQHVLFHTEYVRVERASVYLRSTVCRTVIVVYVQPSPMPLD